MPLAQVNFGVNLASILGITYVIFGAVYLIFTIYLLISRASRFTSTLLTLYIIQLVLVPFCMFVSGLILTFQGWRLDPILQFEQFLLFALIIYFSVKDIFINAISRNR
jgi:hypothetical protein